MDQGLFQPMKTRDRPCLLAQAIFSIVSVVMGVSIGWSAELPEGKWDGSYTLHTGERLEVRYLVTIPQDEEPKDEKSRDEGSKDQEPTHQQPQHYKIKMIILDAEPEITYSLKKIKLNDNQLTFTMDSESEVSDCQLEKQDNKHYIGSCQSNLDPDGTMLADISMIPPNKE